MIIFVSFAFDATWAEFKRHVAAGVSGIFRD